MLDKEALQEKNRIYYEKNKDIINQKRRAGSPKYISQRKKYNKKYREKESSKIKKTAHKIVENAIIAGMISREPCEVCGDPAESHHEDYSKPLDINWLCHIHHMKLHRN